MENKSKGHSAPIKLPVEEFASKPENLKILEAWLKSYKPKELFDKNGRLMRSWPS